MEAPQRDRGGDVIILAQAVGDLLDRRVLELVADPVDGDVNPLDLLEGLLRLRIELLDRLLGLLPGGLGGRGIGPLPRDRLSDRCGRDRGAQTLGIDVLCKRWLRHQSSIGTVGCGDSRRRDPGPG